jgi:hypothetical protein
MQSGISHAVSCFSMRHAWNSIPKFIERLDVGCLCDCGTIWKVTFETGSGLRIVDDGVFWYFSSLSSICILSSVERLGKNRFLQCGSLLMVTFESGSKLSPIEEFAFRYCPSLSSI